MRAPYQLLSGDAIRRWLKGLVNRTGKGNRVARAEPTIEAVADYMGMSRGSIRWIVGRDRPISMERQRLFSRVIAEIENGIIVFELVPAEKGGLKKVAKRCDKPRPIQRYVVHFGKSGVKMIPAPRPPIATTMPSIVQMLAPKRRAN